MNSATLVALEPAEIKELIPQRHPNLTVNDNGGVGVSSAAIGGLAFFFRAKARE